MGNLKIDPTTSDLFQSYYDEYWERLVNFSCRFVKDRGLAEDIVQEVFQAFWEKLDGLKDRGSLSAYLYRSTRNRTINAIKRKSQQIFDKALTLSEGQTDLEETGNKIIENDLASTLNKAVNQLPPRRRMIFKMKIFQQFSNDEISERMDITVPTVKSQFTKGMSYVKSYINNTR